MSRSWAGVASGARAATARRSDAVSAGWNQVSPRASARIAPTSSSSETSLDRNPRAPARTARSSSSASSNVGGRRHRGDRPPAQARSQAGADPLVRQALGFTPLQEAALLGRRDLVDLFLGAGAEINSRSDDGRTAVTEALRGKHPELADYLRSKGGHGAEITADLMAPPKE